MPKLFPLLLVACIAGTIQASELSGLLSHEQLSQVQDNSLLRANAQLNFERSARALGVSLIDKTRVKASVNNSQYFAENDRREDSTLGTIDFTQPLTASLSVGARLTTENQTTLSVDYQPFVKGWVSAQQYYTYEQAKIRLLYAEQKIASEAQRSWQNFLLAEQKVQLAEQKLSFAELEEQVLTEAATLDDVSTNDLLEAQRDRVSAQQALLNAKMSLAEETLTVEQLFAEAVPTKTLPKAVSLQTLVLSNAEQIGQWNARDAQSEALLLAEAKLEFLQASAEDINLFDSDLTFSSSYEMDSEVFKAGVSINLSPSAWNQQERVDAAIDIAMQESEIEQLRQSLLLDVQLQQQRVQLQNESVRVSKLSFEQQSRQLAEVQLLYDLGERTKLELTEQHVRVNDAQLSYQTALLNLLNAQLQLADYFKAL